jgi:glycosyltransferase involved in cell wall biosynthesis
MKPRAVRVAAFARVLLVHGAGGMQAVTEDLVQGLALEGHEIDLYATERPGQDVAIEERNSGSLRTIYLRTGAPGRYSRNWFRAVDREFRRRAAGRKYDVIISFSGAIRGLLQRWRRSGIDLPAIMITFGTHVDEFRAALHSIQADRGPVSLADGLLRAGHVVYRIVRDFSFMRASDMVIASCPGDARKIGAVFRVPANRIRVIPYGVAASLRQRLLRTADLTSRRVTVVARLERDKGIQVCLRALRIVRESVPGVSLRVVGDGSHRSQLEKLARDLRVADITEFVGAVPYDQLADAYAGTAVVVNPRLRPTAYDHALVIGMATGCPVITSDIGDVAFVATADREALYVPAGNPEALARTMITALTDLPLAERIGETARARVEASFTMEQSVSTYSDLLTSLARRVAPAGN